MTAVTTSTTALPTAAANPLASFIGRVKPLDPNELISVANTVAEQQAQLQGGVGATAATPTTQTGGVDAQQRAALEQQLAAAQQQQAVLLQQQQQLAAQAQAPVGTSAPATDTTAVPATDTSVVGAAQTVSPTAATIAAAAQGGAGAATQSTAVDVPSSQIAPRTQHDYWTKHMAQFAGKYLPDGPTMRPNCGPASTTMALRMIGLDIPGFSGQNSEAVLDQARILATGKNDTTVGTTDTELENLITKSGAKWSESNNFSEITNWVKQGIPVVLSGNPAHGWNSRYSKDQVYPFDGGHWVTVSGYDKASGYFIVNDPLSQIGPIYVSEQELKSYNQAHGKLGIAVFR